MSKSEEELKQNTCCLRNDGNFVHEPILLECGANACETCIQSVSLIKCLKCDSYHGGIKNILNERMNIVNTEVDKKVESMTAEIKKFGEDYKKNMEKFKNDIQKFVTIFI